MRGKSLQIKQTTSKKPQAKPEPKHPAKTTKQAPAVSVLYPSIFPSPTFFIPSADINNLIFENFNYSFQNYRLTSALTGGAYTFSDNYDSLGTFVSLYVQSLMIEIGLKQMWVPPDAPSINLFHTADLYENPRLLILIQGKGNVRPGQWSRSICINDSLEPGSMVPYITQARNLNYSVLILNPNIRKDPLTGQDIPINLSSQSHCNYIFQNIVMKTKASQVFIAAHSFGGVCTVSLIKNRSAYFKKKVKAIALLDSVHKNVNELSFDQRKYFQGVSKNWKKSNKAIGTRISNASEGCDCVSGGDQRHEYVSHAAIAEVFLFFSTKG